MSRPGKQRPRRGWQMPLDGCRLDEHGERSATCGRRGRCGSEHTARGRCRWRGYDLGAPTVPALQPGSAVEAARAGTTPGQKSHATLAATGTQTACSSAADARNAFTETEPRCRHRSERHGEAEERGERGDEGETRHGGCGCVGWIYMECGEGFYRQCVSYCWAQDADAAGVRTSACIPHSVVLLRAFEITHVLLINESEHKQ